MGFTPRGRGGPPGRGGRGGFGGGDRGGRGGGRGLYSNLFETTEVYLDGQSL